MTSTGYFCEGPATRKTSSDRPIHRGRTICIGDQFTVNESIFGDAASLIGVKVPTGKPIVVCNNAIQYVLTSFWRNYGAVVDQYRSGPGEYIVRVALAPALPAFSQVSGVLTVRRGPWLCVGVRDCCRRYCRQRSRPLWAT